MDFDWLHSLENSPIFGGGAALMILGAVMAIARNIPLNIWRFFKSRMITSVEITDTDQSFGWVRQWLAEQPAMSRVRNLSAATSWGRSASIGPPSHQSHFTQDAAEIKLSPAPGIYFMRYEGRPMCVELEREESWNNGVYGFAEKIRFRFMIADRKFIHDLLGRIVNSTVKIDGGKTIGIATPVGVDWEVGRRHKIRPPESLILKDGLYDEIIADLERFYDSAQWYADRGVPHRRSLLVFGPPGTGKSTLAAVLAGHFRSGVACISLGSSNVNDHSIVRLFSSTPQRYFLLIEDVDCMFSSSDARQIKDGRITMSGLLNALDGIGLSEGRVIIMTTNHPEKLDPAMIRAGRVDRKIELGYATPDQCRRLFRWFFRDGADADVIAELADRFASHVVPDTLCMAAIQEHLLRFRDSPVEAAGSPISDVRFEKGEDGQYREVDRVSRIAGLNGHVNRVA